MTRVNTIWKTPDAEYLLVYIARVSNPSNQNNTETSPKLLKYLIKHKHWSPFEMVSVCMEIKTTRDIGRQILRHRSFSFQEFSQRYAISDDFSTSEPRMQDEKNRQNSLPVEDRELQRWWEEKQNSVLLGAKQAYADALNMGLAKEVARKVLPEGLTMSTMYMSGTLRSWLHYIDIRCGPETQKEHREVAQLCKEQLEKHFPNVMTAFNDS